VIEHASISYSSYPREEEEREQEPMDKETVGDMKYHELKDEDKLDRFGRRK